MCEELCARGFVRGNKDPAKNDTSELDLVECGLGAKRTHKLTVNGALMANVCLMLMTVQESSHVRLKRRQVYPQPNTPPPAASALVVAAVVVELDLEARTGSRRSIMTDDSRPNASLQLYACESTAMQRLAQVFLYGEAKTPQNDRLDVGPYQTRPDCHSCKHADWRACI